MSWQLGCLTKGALSTRPSVCVSGEVFHLGWQSGPFDDTQGPVVELALGEAEL